MQFGSCGHVKSFRDIKTKAAIYVYFALEYNYKNVWRLRKVSFQFELVLISLIAIDTCKDHLLHKPYF